VKEKPVSTVDVVVPCYAYGRYLAQCVTSVLDQQGPDVRVLIIDDASPDETPEIARALARRDDRVEVRRHPRNRGHIATYNEGIDWASSDYMLLLSADDYLLPGALARATRVLDAHGDVGFVFGRALGGTANGFDRDAFLAGKRRSEGEVEIMSGARFLQVSKALAIVPTPTAVVRVCVQKRIGGYRPDLPHTADVDMWYRFAANGRVGVIGAFQAVYRLHGDNMSHAYFRRHKLPDLTHRRDAIETFFRGDGASMVDGPRLRARMIEALAVEAIGHASAAFNAGDLAACTDLEAFAIALTPRVRGTPAWMKLDCKKRLGVRRWQTLAPAVSGVRHVARLGARGLRTFGPAVDRVRSLAPPGRVRP
jgi:GT2 family glycosyltransferase